MCHVTNHMKSIKCNVREKHGQQKHTRQQWHEQHWKAIKDGRFIHHESVHSGQRRNFYGHRHHTHARFGHVAWLWGEITLPLLLLLLDNSKTTSFFRIIICFATLSYSLLSLSPLFYLPHCCSLSFPLKELLLCLQHCQ